MPRKKVNRPSFVKSSKTPQRKKTGCGGASGSNKNPSVSCVNLSSSDVGTDENACDRDSMDTATELPPSTSGALTGSQRSAKGILAYKKITKYSGVWNHFLVQTLDNKETGKVQCIHCPKDGKTGLLTPGGSTGTMNTHMRGHDIVPKGSSQRTLDNLVKKVTPISAREKKEIEDSLVEMVASDGCPLSIVEKPGFKRYTAKLLGLSQKEFTLPSRRTLGRRLKDKAIEGVEKVKTLLEAVTNLGAITCDLRSDRRHRTYITVTFHVVDANFVLQKIVLATRRIRFRRTGEIIAKEVREILESFGVLDKVAEAVTDNGGDVKKAMRLLNKNRISCFAHLLHLALVNGLGLWVKSPMADPVAPAAEANVDPSCAEVNPGASSAEPDQIGEQESEWRDLNLDEEAEEEDDAEDIDIFWKKTYLKVSTQVLFRRPFKVPLRKSGNLRICSAIVT